MHDTKQLVDERLRDAGDLIAIIGTDLLAADKAKLYSKQGDTPTEKERIEEAQVIATYGGLPSFSVPFFPVNGVVVTSWDKAVASSRHTASSTTPPLRSACAR